MMKDLPSLAIVVSHPIQYFVLFYRKLALYPGLTTKVISLKDLIQDHKLCAFFM